MVVQPVQLDMFALAEEDRQKVEKENIKRKNDNRVRLLHHLLAELEKNIEKTPQGET